MIELMILLYGPLIFILCFVLLLALILWWMLDAISMPEQSEPAEETEGE